MAEIRCDGFLFLWKSLRMLWFDQSLENGISGNYTLYSKSSEHHATISEWIIISNGKLLHVTICVLFNRNGSIKSVSSDTRFTVPLKIANKTSFFSLFFFSIIQATLANDQNNAIFFFSAFVVMKCVFCSWCTLHLCWMKTKAEWLEYEQSSTMVDVE